jgi:hypothetical protein
VVWDVLQKKLFQNWVFLAENVWDEKTVEVWFCGFGLSVCISLSLFQLPFLSLNWDVCRAEASVEKRDKNLLCISVSDFNASCIMNFYSRVLNFYQMEAVSSTQYHLHPPLFKQQIRHCGLPRFLKLKYWSPVWSLIYFQWRFRSCENFRILEHRSILIFHNKQLNKVTL